MAPVARVFEGPKISKDILVQPQAECFPCGINAENRMRAGETIEVV